MSGATDWDNWPVGPCCFAEPQRDRAARHFGSASTPERAAVAGITRGLRASRIAHLLPRLLSFTGARVGGARAEFERDTTSAIAWPSGRGRRHPAGHVAADRRTPYARAPPRPTRTAAGTATGTTRAHHASGTTCSRNGFGNGFNGPLLLAVRHPRRQDRRTHAPEWRRGAHPGVAAVAPPIKPNIATWPRSPSTTTSPESERPQAWSTSLPTA